MKGPTSQLKAVLTAAVFFLLALALRLHRIGDVQVQFDEWLGGWHANPDLRWTGSCPDFIEDFWGNTRDYIASGQTIAWSALVELYQFAGARGVIPVRVLAALSGAFSAAAVFLAAGRLLSRDPAAALGAGFMSAFGVVGVVFGQFADVYASALFASSLQILLYAFLVHPRPQSTRNWTVFFLGAACSGFLMYTQVWLTAGLLSAAAVTALVSGRFRRTFARALPGFLIYLVLSAIHLWSMLQVISWSESYRWYMSGYYPLFLRDPGSGSWAKIFPYLAVRVFDFFSYQWAAVFDPRLYQPLTWNPVMIPFLLIAVCAVSGRIVRSFFCRRPRRFLPQAPRDVRSGAIAPRGSDAVILAGTAVLAVTLAGNCLFLLPFGGIRQTLFLAPIAALMYGWILSQFRFVPAGRWKRPAGILRWCGVFLPLLPFIVSYPALYRDRVSRLDLDFLAESLRRTGVADLAASEQNIQILEIALNSDPRFSAVHWPGYRHPSDALDADFRKDRPVLCFEFEGTTRRVHWVTRDYFPAESVPLIWIDMHISRGSRFEGPVMKQFYPDPEETVGGHGEIMVLLERPGNSPASRHQSLYWPPNSYYLYLVVPRTD